jgi:hypothetical protein
MFTHDTLLATANAATRTQPLAVTITQNKGLGSGAELNIVEKKTP